MSDQSIKMLVFETPGGELWMWPPGKYFVRLAEIEYRISHMGQPYLWCTTDLPRFPEVMISRITYAYLWHKQFGEPRPDDNTENFVWLKGRHVFVDLEHRELPEQGRLAYHFKRVTLYVPPVRL